MDRASVGLGMLCAWWGPAGPMISNDDVAALCAAHPDRFVGVASVDLMRPMAAVAELRRWVEEFGFRALRVRDLGQARQRGRCRNGALAMTQAT